MPFFQYILQKKKRRPEYPDVFCFTNLYRFPHDGIGRIRTRNRRTEKDPLFELVPIEPRGAIQQLQCSTLFVRTNHGTGRNLHRNRRRIQRRRERNRRRNHLSRKLVRVERNGNDIERFTQYRREINCSSNIVTGHRTIVPRKVGITRGTGVFEALVQEQSRQQHIFAELLHDIDNKTFRPTIIDTFRIGLELKHQSRISRILRIQATAVDNLVFERQGGVTALDRFRRLIPPPALAVLGNLDQFFSEADQAGREH